MSPALAEKPCRCGRTVSILDRMCDECVSDAMQNADLDFVAAQAMINKACAERDRMRRLWNRLEAAVTHHKNAHDDLDALFVDDADAALWKVRDKILKDYAEGNG